jgi:HEAT repeat protein
VHPRLVRLAGSDEVPTETRRSAVFWAGQEGAPLEELRRLYGRVPDRVKEHVIFAFSQREEPEAARELLRLARSPEEPADLRKNAVFWLGQAAGRAVTAELGEMVDDPSMDVEVREHAIFALSQRPADEGVPALIRIVRESPDPRLKEKAIFWLGQSGDPRALSLFAEILRIR